MKTKCATTNRKESIANQARNRRHRAKAHNKKTCKKGSHRPVTSQERHHGGEEQTRGLQTPTNDTLFTTNTDGINTRVTTTEEPLSSLQTRLVTTNSGR